MTTIKHDIKDILKEKGTIITDTDIKQYGVIKKIQRKRKLKIFTIGSKSNVFEILNQPTGGGNQFLKMLKKQFDSMSLLTSEPSEADIFLFNSHHFLQNVASYKKSFPKTL